MSPDMLDGSPTKCCEYWGIRCMRRCKVPPLTIVLYRPLSKLLVSPLITPIVVPYRIPYTSPFKEFRLWVIWTVTLSACILRPSSHAVQKQDTLKLSAPNPGKTTHAIEGGLEYPDIQKMRFGGARSAHEQRILGRRRFRNDRLGV